MCHPPRLEIIEMLFQAGADINLPTLSGKSPLMVFVENASPNKFPDLHHHLVFYLVKDLRASLFYKDSQLETVLHVAAERGHCPRTLAALLSCDTGKVLYEMKNKRLLVYFLLLFLSLPLPPLVCDQSMLHDLNSFPCSKRMSVPIQSVLFVPKHPFLPSARSLPRAPSL